MAIYHASKRMGLVMTTVAALAVTGMGAASAQNVHLKPPNSTPTFNDKGVTLEASGTLAGLGNGDILVTLTATGNPTATCTNPAGATQPPGQNPAQVTLTGSQAIPQSQVKNGTVGFDVTTEPPISPIPGAPGCPNPNWTERITDVSFTTAVISVEQNDMTVLSLTCAFSPATTGGIVRSGQVSCTPTTG
jgi:hypothetical protein